MIRNEKNGYTRLHFIGALLILLSVAVGADAGVSATAVIKHFGSKDTLHDECDAHVITIIGHYKTDALRSSDLRGTVLTQMATLEEFQPLVRYLMRSFLEGGEAARRLLERRAELEPTVRVNLARRLAVQIAGQLAIPLTDIRAAEQFLQAVVDCHGEVNRSRL